MSIQRLFALYLLGAVTAACEPGEPVTPAKTGESSPPSAAVPEVYSPGEDLSAAPRSMAPDAAALVPPPDMPQDYAPPAEESGTFGDHDGPAMEELMSVEPPDDVPVMDDSSSGVPDDSMPNDMMSEDIVPDDAMPDVQEQDTAGGLSDQP